MLNCRAEVFFIENPSDYFFTQRLYFWPLLYLPFDELEDYQLMATTFRREDSPQNKLNLSLFE